MQRVIIRPEGTVTFRYLDSVHAALVAAMRAAGADEASLLGANAAPWTFAVKGFSKAGGESTVTAITLSTGDADLGRVVSRIDPSRIRWNSDNGDRIDFGIGRVSSMSDPVMPGRSEMAVAFASPLLVTNPNRTVSNEFLGDLRGFPLSEFLSRGLTRRIGRPATVEAVIDPLILATEGRRVRLVSLRAAPNGRRVIVPAFPLKLTLRGAEEDLRAAYFAGLGDKTRYGFGCLLAAK